MSWVVGSAVYRMLGYNPFEREHGQARSLSYDRIAFTTSPRVTGSGRPRLPWTCATRDTVG